MRSTTLLVLAALVAGVCAQLTGNAQSAVNAAYQSVVRALDGQSTTVSFARVQSTTDGSGGLVTSSVPNPEVRRVGARRRLTRAGRRDLHDHDVRSRRARSV